MSIYLHLDKINRRHHLRMVSLSKQHILNSLFTVNYKDKKVINIHLHTFNKILDDFLSNSSTVFVISDASIKNNIITLILYICFNKSIITKTYFIVISQDLRTFFNKSSNNSIAFWDCPSSTKWPLHSAVDKETKKFKINPTTLCKLSWDFSKKEECDLILCNWQITF